MSISANIAIFDVKFLTNISIFTKKQNIVKK